MLKQFKAFPPGDTRQDAKAHFELMPLVTFNQAVLLLLLLLFCH